jgi:glutathione reductase (NADPH)
MDKFDVVIIGSGAAARSAARELKKAKKHVAMIERGDWGGTCPNAGCDPKKILYAAADLYDQVQHVRGIGIDYNQMEIDWKDLIEFKHKLTKHTPDETKKALNRMGVLTYKGEAEFIDKNKIKVGEDELEAKRFIIATGVKPKKLNIKGEELITTSAEFMRLEELPKKIIFIGGGYISMELAHIAKRADSEVLVFEESAKVLKEYDQEIVRKLIVASKENGINIMTQSKVVEIDKKYGKLRVKIETPSSTNTFKADMIVHGAGRVPALDSLNLQKAKVKTDKHGVVVDENLRSVSNEDVYAAGDCSNQGPNLTPVAVKQGEVAGQNIYRRNKLTIDYSALPSIVFTIPKLAKVGMDEKQAKKKGIDFKVISKDHSEWYYAERKNIEFVFSKIIIDQKKKTIIGAHLLGGQADEFINFFALAIDQQIKIEDLESMFYTYPSITGTLPDMLKNSSV